MLTEQISWNFTSGWNNGRHLNGRAQLVLAFGGISTLGNGNHYEALKTEYPNADIVFCSTAGEISSSGVADETISGAACSFEHTNHRIASVKVNEYSGSLECGKAICEKLKGEDLSHILVFSDGIQVNGDELLAGINTDLESHIIVTGGLAADGGQFAKTLVGVNSNPESGQIVAIGFYGRRLQITHGSRGGWNPFGPVRTVTLSKNNILYALDGQKALDIYKRYLGDKASELPGSALLFPLCILDENNPKSQLVRTILAVNEEEGSMTFAGNIPEGAQVQFMMANIDRLIDGAADAAEDSVNPAGKEPDLVLMVSCVGRKIVLDQRIDEEVESVIQALGNNPVYTGFYSNGEISPLADSVNCSLHNQTMTITTYREN
ncbi:MAG: FIST signal transduction protein [Flavobacteriales bacterium]